MTSTHSQNFWINCWWNMYQMSVLICSANFCHYSWHFWDVKGVGWVFGTLEVNKRLGKKQKNKQLSKIQTSQENISGGTFRWLSWESTNWILIFSCFEYLFTFLNDYYYYLQICDPLPVKSSIFTVPIGIQMKDISCLTSSLCR